MTGMEYENQKAKEDRFRQKLKVKSKSKFVGVRQRASGKWAAEIKDTSKKIRMWLGTYQTAEEAARAYDEAACLLRGSNTRTNFSTHGHAIADATNSPISLKLRNLIDRKAISNQIQIQIQDQSTVISPTLQGSAHVMEDNSALCGSSGEGKPLFWVQNQVSDNPYELDMMNMINCSMGIAPNASPQLEYSWPLAQQKINELPIPKDVLSVENRQLSASVYDMTVNECYGDDTYKYEYDANYPLSHFFCFS